MLAEMYLPLQSYFSRDGMLSKVSPLNFTQTNTKQSVIICEFLLRSLTLT